MVDRRLTPTVLACAVLFGLASRSRADTHGTAIAYGSYYELSYFRSLSGESAVAGVRLADRRGILSVLLLTPPLTGPCQISDISSSTAVVNGREYTSTLTTYRCWQPTAAEQRRIDRENERRLGFNRGVEITIYGDSIGSDSSGFEFDEYPLCLTPKLYGDLPTLLEFGVGAGHSDSVLADLALLISATFPVTRFAQFEISTRVGWQMSSASAGAARLRLGGSVNLTDRLFAGGFVMVSSSGGLQPSHRGLELGTRF
ncbi:MAG TPA: hypothetical protein VML75_22515 [Kofleriaceae bacterium]|nr:hypothetical protein [Kofleriaceae bacterium]